jgi:aryl-alcohol dehydrogenase-like predicted oxidoreductase
MASGLLTGAMTRERVATMADNDWHKRDAEFQEPRFSHNMELVQRLRTVGERLGRSPGEVALAWTLHNPAVTGAIVGSRSPAQIEGIIGAGEFRLTNNEVREIEAS